MPLTKLLVSSMFHDCRPLTLLTSCIAKATDENLTSENWEYILVSVSYDLYSTGGRLTTCRMFATGQMLKIPGRTNGSRPNRDYHANALYLQTKGCGCFDDQAPRTSKRKCSDLYAGGMPMLLLSHEQCSPYSQLANALSQNCGPKVHRELASRSFTDALLRLAGDRVCLKL